VEFSKNFLRGCFGERGWVGGTQVECRWNAGGMQVECRWNAGGMQVECRWNAGGMQASEVN
jgi:hypothetical protein